MDELARREGILTVMTCTKLAPRAVSSEIVVQNGTKISLGDMATLGAGVQPLAEAVQGVINTSQGGSGYYKVIVPPGKKLSAFKNEPAFFSGVRGANGQFDAQARMTPMLCDPMMVFVAVALANINQKLDVIQETQKEMMAFLERKEKSALRGNLDFLLDVYNNYKHNRESEKYKTANHIKALDIRQHAAQMIDFYREQIKARVSKQTFLHTDQDVQKQLEQVADDFKEYQLALYLFAFAYFLEVLLQENYDETYLNAVATRIDDFSVQYRELYTEVYSHIEKYSKTSLQSGLFSGLSVATKAAGKAIARIPVIGQYQIDETLIETSERLEVFGNNRLQNRMQQLVERQSGCVRPFIDNIVMISQMYNHALTLVFNEKALYIGIYED